ncbi:hypothetical protein T4A_5804 [Trichinella pseudospiralis]|uniref:Uncharacterized protein n=2 Tax=Trichinella pseudospiralis TaxID=6337 RepID=A0A0V1EFI1_TRIPS|nr:hypothetical protein T4A_5804 [Trichinella pseudospiralis]KRZ29170.1 hypothetical protein T4C_6288 [Trichinella pseudospiralis]
MENQVRNHMNATVLVNSISKLYVIHMFIVTAAQHGKVLLINCHSKKFCTSDMLNNVLNVQSENLFDFLSAEGKERLVIVLFLNKKYSASSIMLGILEELAFQVCRAVFVQVDFSKVGLSFDNRPFSLCIAPSYSFYYNSFRIDFTRTMCVFELNKKLQYWLDALKGSKLSSHGLLFPSDECEILYRICEEYKVNKKCDHRTVDYFFQFAPSLSLETLVEKYPSLFRVISWMISSHIAEQETNIQLKLCAKLALHIAKISAASAPVALQRNYLKWLNSLLKVVCKILGDRCYFCVCVALLLYSEKNSFACESQLPEYIEKPYLMLEMPSDVAKLCTLYACCLFNRNNAFATSEKADMFYKFLHLCSAFFPFKFDLIILFSNSITLVEPGNFYSTLIDNIFCN